MRKIEEANIALECLRLAALGPYEHQSLVIARAEAFYAFVAGTDTEAAKATLDAVRKVVSQGRPS